jgi:hypothetical protein
MTRWTDQIASSVRRPSLGELNNGFRSDWNPSGWPQCLWERPWPPRSTERRRWVAYSPFPKSHEEQKNPAREPNAVQLRSFLRYRTE